MLISVALIVIAARRSHFGFCTDVVCGGIKSVHSVQVQEAEYSGVEGL